ncbi:unannotated protein [freshwater metagenome]|uniref:Unannotated protein n=1 Tax=freshwater metagenome TaxID=449393 RepID=A0A6J7VT87_9ZZZZ
MRLDSKATWVSGLPVSVGVDPYCATIAAVASGVSAMFDAPIFSDDHGVFRCTSRKIAFSLDA